MPGSNNVINNTILDNAGFGTLPPLSTAQVSVLPLIPLAGATTGMLVNPSFSSLSATVYGQIISPSFNPTTGGTYDAVYGLSIAPTIGTGTITSAYGLKISPTAAASSTVINAYSLYVTNAGGSGNILNNYTAILGTDPNTLVGMGDIAPLFTLSVAGIANTQNIIGYQAGTTAQNQLITLAEGYDQSGFGGGSVGTNKVMSANTTQYFNTTLVGGGSYNGAVFDGRYLYLIPLGPPGGPSSATITRYDSIQPFSSVSSYTSYNLLNISSNSLGYRGALFDGRYVYMVPSGSTFSTRYDTFQSFNSASSYTTFDVSQIGNSAGFYGGVFDGRYVYFCPFSSVTMTRYDTTLSFTLTSSYTAVSLAPVTQQRTFGGGIFDGRYIYLVPIFAVSIYDDFSVTIVRYDTTLSFTSQSSFTSFDLSLISVFTQYDGGVFDGRYIYLMPLKYGTVTRYDTQQNFNSPGSYTTFNVNPLLSIDNAGFSGGTFDGRYIYFAPWTTGRVLAFDTTKNFNSIGSYTVYNTEPNAGNGFIGAAFDGRYAYFIPNQNSTVIRIDAYPGPLASSLAANQAPNGFAVGTYVGTAVPQPNTLLISGSMGVNTAAPQYTLDVRGTIRAQVMYGTILTTTALHSLTTNNQTINLTEGNNQGGLCSGVVGLNKTMSANTTAFLDTTAYSAGSQQFSGAIFDGIYLYLIPGSINSVPSGTITLYDTRLPFVAASCSCFDVSQLNTKSVNFWGALYDKRYIYLIPSNNGTSGVLTRYDTLYPFSYGTSYTTFDTTQISPFSRGFAGGIFDGRYLYLSPYTLGGGVYSGTVLRFDTESSFTAMSSYTCFDLATVHSNNRGFIGGTYDGQYVYFAPNHNNTSGLIARFDTAQSFTAMSSYTVFDMATIASTCVGFVNAAFDGRYVYFAPNNNGASGLVVRYDTTKPFTAILSYETFDTTTVCSQSRGFAGAVFDNRYVYFIPGLANFGTITRYDTTLPFNSPSSYMCLGTAGINSNSTQFMGAVYDGRYLFLAPAGNGQITRIDAYPGQQAAAMAIYQAPNGLSVGSFAAMATSPNAAYANALIAGNNMSINTPRPTNALDVVGTVNATSLQINNFLPLHNANNAQLATMTQGTNQGGMGGGSVGTNLIMCANTTNVFDLTKLSSNATGFDGAAFDGRFIYYVPNHSPVYSGEIMRFDTTLLPTSQLSYGTFNTTAIHSQSKGFQGAIFDGRYVYFIPSQGGTSGVITRYDANLDFYIASSYSAFDASAVSTWSRGFYGAVFDGHYLYFVPNRINGVNSGTVTRFDTTLSFSSASSYTCFNLTQLNSNNIGFIGGTYDGRYVYFVPNNSNQSGLVARYDTTLSFTATSGFTCFDMKTVHSLAQGFYGAIFDSRYIYFVPFNNGGAQSGLITRFDTQQSFTVIASYTCMDISAGSAGFIGGCFDGRYIYFAPNNNGSAYGTVARFDTTMAFLSSSSYSFFNAASIHSQAIGFAGAMFDGKSVYFVPSSYGIIASLNAYPGPLATSTAANQAPNGFAVGAYAGTAIPPAGGMIVSGKVGAGTASPAYTLDVNGTIHGTQLNAVAAYGLLGSTANNQLVALAEGYNQGGFGGSSISGQKQMSLTNATVFNLQSINSVLEGFRGCAFDGRFLYLVPCFSNLGSNDSGTVVRYDTTQSFSSGTSYTIFDLTTVQGVGKGYAGAVYDGKYVYFVPQNARPTVCRYDTTKAFTLSSSYSTFNLATAGFNGGSFGGLFDGRYVYYSPGSTAVQSKAIRYDTALSFDSPSSYTLFSLSSMTNKVSLYYSVGVFDGRYIYYPPIVDLNTSSGTILRYDSTGAFNSSSSWTTFNIKPTGGLTYSSACYDGRYIYYAPNRDFQVLRYDSQQSFTNTNSYQIFAVATSLSNNSASMFNSCMYDGRYVYFTPAVSGWVARYDATRLFTAQGSWTLFNLTSMDANCLNYQGIMLDGRYIYLAPTNGGLIARIDAYPGQQTNALAASQAPNGLAIGSYAGTATPPAGGLIVSGNVGIGLAIPTFSLHLALDSAFKSGTNLWTNTSDQRIKQNIEDIPDALSTIRQLNPCKFNYHPDYAKDIGADPHSTYYGFIADEVEKVMEGCVRRSGCHCYGGQLRNWFGNQGTDPAPIPGMENLKTLNIHNILVYGVQAVKELEAQIKELNEKLNKLSK